MMVYVLALINIIINIKIYKNIEMEKEAKKQKIKKYILFLLIFIISMAFIIFAGMSVSAYVKSFEVDDFNKRSVEVASGVISILDLIFLFNGITVLLIGIVMSIKSKEMKKYIFSNAIIIIIVSGLIYGQLMFLDNKKIEYHDLMFFGTPSKNNQMSHGDGVLKF